jgi:hypothetical protein
MNTGVCFILGKPTRLAHGCKKGSLFHPFCNLNEIYYNPTWRLTTSRMNIGVRLMFEMYSRLFCILHNKLLWRVVQEKTEEGLGSTILWREWTSQSIRIGCENCKLLQVGWIVCQCDGVDRPKEGGGVPSPRDISMTVDKLTKELDGERLGGLNYITISRVQLLLID